MLDVTAYYLGWHGRNLTSTRFWCRTVSTKVPAAPGSRQVAWQPLIHGEVRGRELCKSSENGLRPFSGPHTKNSDLAEGIGAVLPLRGVSKEDASSLARLWLLSSRKESNPGVQGREATLQKGTYSDYPANPKGKTNLSKKKNIM